MSDDRGWEGGRRGPNKEPVPGTDPDVVVVVPLTRRTDIPTDMSFIGFSPEEVSQRLAARFGPGRLREHHTNGLYYWTPKQKGMTRCVTF